MAHFTLTSKTFFGQVPIESVYHDFGAGGGNQSPDLSWANAPEGTESFMIILHDPDAPGPGGWWHWCAFDIPASCHSLAMDASSAGMPEGTIQVKNSYGGVGFGGACPPPGDQAHAYHLTILALKTKSLGLHDQVSPAMALFVADEHVIGKAGITAFYSR